MNPEQRKIEERECWSCSFFGPCGFCERLELVVDKEDSCPAHAFRPKNCSMCRHYSPGACGKGFCTKRKLKVRPRMYCDWFQDIPKDKCETCAYYTNRGVVGDCKLHGASTTPSGWCDGHRMKGSIALRDPQKDGYPTLSALRSGRVRAITEDDDGKGIEVEVGPKLLFQTKDGDPIPAQFWISVKDEDSD